MKSEFGDYINQLRKGRGTGGTDVLPARRPADFSMFPGRRPSAFRIPG